MDSPQGILHDQSGAVEAALESIEEELNDRSKWFAKQGKELERYRFEQKTEYDLEC